MKGYLEEHISELESENALLRQACADAEEMLEKAPLDETHCPKCRLPYKLIKRNGHAPDCRLAALLDRLAKIREGK